MHSPVLDLQCLLQCLHQVEDGHLALPWLRGPRDEGDIPEILALVRCIRLLKEEIIACCVLSLNQPVKLGDVLVHQLAGFKLEQDGRCKEDLPGKAEVMLLERLDEVDVALRNQGDINIPGVHPFLAHKVIKEGLPGNLVLLGEEREDAVSLLCFQHENPLTRGIYKPAGEALENTLHVKALPPVS